MLHHRLLAIDVLARVEGRNGDVVVPMVGGNHEDGIHVRPGQNFAVVAGGEQGFVLAKRILSVFEPTRIQIGAGYQFNIGVTQGGLRIEVTLNTHANGGNANFIVGANFRQVRKYRPETRMVWRCFP